MCVCVCVFVCVCVLFLLLLDMHSRNGPHTNRKGVDVKSQTQPQQRQEQQKSVANHNKCLDVFHWSSVLQVHTTLLTGGSSGVGGSGYGMGGGGFSGGGFGGGARGPPRDGDWPCPDCGSNVFASRSEVSVLQYLLMSTDSCASCLSAFVFVLSVSSPH